MLVFSRKRLLVAVRDITTVHGDLNLNRPSSTLQIFYFIIDVRPDLDTRITPENVRAIS